MGQWVGELRQMIVLSVALLSLCGGRAWGGDRKPSPSPAPTYYISLFGDLFAKAEELSISQKDQLRAVVDHAHRSQDVILASKNGPSKEQFGKIEEEARTSVKRFLSPAQFAQYNKYSRFILFYRKPPSSPIADGLFGDLDR